MTPAAYTAALATLGLNTPAEAARWLGVSLRTAQRYAVDGPSEMARRVVELALRLRDARQIVVNEIAELFSEMPVTQRTRELAKAALRYAIVRMNQ